MELQASTRRGSIDALLQHQQIDLLRSAGRPWGLITWTGRPHVQQILRALARGGVPLTHDGLSQLSPWRSVAYTRDLLMECGILPPADRHLLLFQRRLTDCLPEVDNLDHRKILERYATWHLLRQLRAAAAKGPLGQTRQRGAQPVTRIVRLTIDDVSHDGDQLLLRLGEPPSPVSTPFAALLQTYIQTRPNTATATNPNSRWPFPGRRAGQPMTTEALHGRLRKADIPRLNARTASIRQLVLQAPASVVAEMLGYHVEHAENLAAEGGGTWKTYAPGDHTQ